MVEGNPIEQAAKAGLLAPVGQLAQMGLALPQQLLADSGSSIASQVKELPEIAKKNMEYFQQQIKDVPENIRAFFDSIASNNKEMFKDGFPLKTLFPPIGPASTETKVEPIKKDGNSLLF